MTLLQEFKPALTFLSKFLAFYLIANILYGLYVKSHEDKPDNITRVVTAHTSGVLNGLGYNTSFNDVDGVPKVSLKQAGDVVLNVYEGCNGVNVMIVFVAFLVAFGGPTRWFFVFIPGGLLIIHIFNLLRIGLLFDLALSNSAQFYYYHKYFFTATLYLVVFGLWVVWVLRFDGKRNASKAAG